MTGDQVITRAKARVKNTNSIGYDWNFFYQTVIDEIFSFKEWRFNRQELNYIHAQSAFEKTFDGSATELSLNKILTLRFTRSYTIVMGVPIPVSNSVQSLPFETLQTFRMKYPDEQIDGEPICFTELHANDGLTGMQIGIYPRPASDAAIWIDGIFIPSYDITNSSVSSTEIPILPKQFHRMIVFGVASLAAGQAGQPQLATDERAIYLGALKQLVDYDLRNPSQGMLKKSISDTLDYRKQGPFFPSNFPRGYSR